MRLSLPLHRGFTLIEVLVSLALMVMISTILITSLQIGGHSWQRVTRAASDTDDIAQAQEFLRRHLSSAYPLAHPDTIRTKTGSILSDGESIEFSSAAPDSSSEGVWRYHVSVSSDTGALEVRSRRDRRVSSDTLPYSWSSATLLSHARSLTVQFWLKPTGLPGRWVDRWVDHNEPPKLIRIDVTFAANDSRRWPSLYIEPRVDTSVNCEFDMVSRNCRSGS